MALSSRSVTKRAVAFLTLTSLGLGLLLPLMPAAIDAGAYRVSDTGILGTKTVRSFETTLVGTETSHNTTLMVPVNATAAIVGAQVNVSGRFLTTFLNLSGQGGAGRDQELYGQAIHGGGDFNHDGYPDLAIGAPAQQVFPTGEGRVDVFYGSSRGIAGKNSNWSYTGGGAGAGFGHSIAHGDYNGDGIDDLVVGDAGTNVVFPPIVESIYVFFGSDSGLPSSPNLTLTFDSGNLTSWGFALAGNLDVNNDTYSDLVVGEPFFGGSFQGRTMVLWGGPDGLSVANYTAITPVNTTDFGNTLAALGDTDGNGLGEFAVGAHATAANNGEVDVYEGVQGTFNLTKKWSKSGSSGEYFGWSISGGADLTGDGKPDLAVGAPVFNTLEGAVYIFNGTGNATYAASAGYTLLPVSGTQEQFGAGMDIAGDIDGDGTNDLVVGGNRYSNFDGRLQIYTKANFSQTAPRIVDINSTGLAESFGWVVARAGDLNKDGVGDYAVMLASGINGTTHPGSVRVYYGTAHPYPENVRVFVNRTLVWNSSGAVSQNTTTGDFSAVVQAYIAAHQADANATGIILVPLAFNFTLGGILNVSAISIRYSVLIPPAGVTVTAPAAGGALLVSWQLHATDGDVFSVWSNKTGSWQILQNLSFLRSSFNDTNVTDGQRYWYYVSEWDSSVLLQSLPSPIVSGVPVDVTPPRVPQNLSIAKNATAHTITLMWLPNSDDTLRYEVWRRAGDTAPFLFEANVSVPAFTFADTGLLEEVNYTYEVRAIDDAALASNFSVQVTERLPDLTPPAMPQNLAASTLASGTGATLTWDLNPDDTVGYAILRSLTGAPGSFSEINQTVSSPFDVLGLSRNQTYFFQVVAIDKVALRSPPSAAVSVRTVDTQPPGSPVLTGASSTGVGNSVQVNWTAAGDDLNGFRVYTNASGSWQSVQQVSRLTLSFVVTNLTDGVPAYFRVTAFDFGGLEGLPSNVLSATPTDTVRPAAPGGLTVTAPPVGASLVVSWSAPADTDVAGYKVWFIDPTVSADWQLAATLGPVTTYNHTGLKNGVTYRYQVSAFDEVPNESPPSLGASGTPRDTIAPAAPRITTESVVTNHVTFGINGTTEPHLNVELWVRGVLQATVAADAAGAWSADARLIRGDNEIYARAVDPSPLIDQSAKFSQNSQTLHITLDPDRPTLASTTPAADATNVDPSLPVVAVFSEAVQVSTLRITLRDSDGNLVEGNLTVDSATHTARFQPSAPLKAGATYRATIEAKDLAGNDLAPTSFAFTTASGATGHTGGGFLPGFEGALAAATMALAAVALASRRRRA